MDSPSLVARLKSILLAPKSAWEPIAAETTTVGALYRNWILWLAAVTPLCTFLGLLLFGVPTLPGLVFHPPFGTLLAQLVLGYGLGLLVIYLWALAASALAPNFGGRADRVSALKLVAYAATPVWVVGILHLLPALGLLAGLLTLAALGYTVWHLYLGAPLVQGVPAARARGYVATLVVVGVVLALATGALTGLLTATSLSGRSFGSFTASSTKPGASPATGTTARARSPVGPTGVRAAEIRPIRPLSAAQIRGFLPSSLPGWTRLSYGAFRAAAGPRFMTSKVHAVYGRGKSRLRLSVTDEGELRGLLAMAALVDKDDVNANGYVKVRTRDGRTVTERWNDRTHRGLYSVVVGRRFVVAAHGRDVTMEELRSAVRAVPLRRLARLANTPGPARP